MMVTHRRSRIQSPVDMEFMYDNIREGVHREVIKDRSSKSGLNEHERQILTGLAKHPCPTPENLTRVVKLYEQLMSTHADDSWIPIRDRPLARMVYERYHQALALTIPEEYLT